MPFPAWTFRPMDRGEINVDPVHDEFFKAQDLADALVRESIQNSLDARRGRSAVKVRYRFAELADARPYFRGFEEHFAAAVPDGSLPAGPMPYLLIEDSGTRGLTGDPGGDPDLDADGARNDFYYFWRNVGRSSKGETDRGRWGLGKAVFAVSSRIRTIFGLTHRADDSRQLLLGQSVLKTHVLDGAKFDPYGFFGDRDRHLPLPLDAPALLDTFSRDFGIARGEPGLSIVVPWVRQDDLTLENLAASVLRQYFYPIVRGDLVVVIENATRHETIASKTIDDVASRLLGNDAASLRELCELTRWSITFGPESLVSLQVPGPGAPKWSESLFGADHLESLRTRFESGERIALRAPLHVKKKKGRAVQSHFDVFLQKDESLRRAEQHFLRRGITITDLRVPNDKPVRALAVVDDEALSTLLGDAENPAHSDWMERADKIKHYDLGPTTVRFVRQSIAQISSILARPPQGRVRDFLADLFSIEADEAEIDRGERGTGDEPGGNQGEAPIAVALTATPSRRGPKIATKRGGFVIKGKANAEELGRGQRAEVAYRCRNGNPFRKYDPFDFELGKNVAVAARGAVVKHAAHNTLEFTPEAAEYEIELTGFDVRRDVIVRVSEMETDAAETELH